MPHDSFTCAVELSSATPAFVNAPTFVFDRAASPPSRSEILRRQIVAAQEVRRSLGG